MPKGFKGKFKAVLLVLAIIAGIGLYIFYRIFYYHNVNIEEKSRLIYIHTGWDFEQVEKMLVDKHIISHTKGFEIVSGMKGYKNHVIPGRYRVVNVMSNTQLVNLLVSGHQEPETMNLYNIRTKYDLAGIIANKIEADSNAVVKYFNDGKYLKQF